MLVRKPRLMLGVSGSSALVSLLPELARLRQQVDDCVVIMTPAASRLVSPVLVGSVLHSSVYIDIFSPSQPTPVHSELAARSDIALIAPATLNTLSSLASASTSNLLTLALANFSGPVGLIPAINEVMQSKPATQRVLRQLVADGFFIGSEESGAATDLAGKPQPGVSKHELRKIFVRLVAEYANRDSS